MVRRDKMTATVADSGIPGPLTERGVAVPCMRLGEERAAAWPAGLAEITAESLLIVTEISARPRLARTLGSPMKRPSAGSGRRRALPDDQRGGQLDPVTV